MYFQYKNECRIFKPVEITIRRGLRKKKRKKKPNYLLFHDSIYQRSVPWLILSGLSQAAMLSRRVSVRAKREGLPYSVALVPDGGPFPPCGLSSWTSW
jgi:hypothetical protein